MQLSQSHHTTITQDLSLTLTDLKWVIVASWDRDNCTPPFPNLDHWQYSEPCSETDVLGGTCIYPYYLLLVTWSDAHRRCITKRTRVSVSHQASETVEVKIEVIVYSIVHHSKFPSLGWALRLCPSLNQGNKARLKLLLWLEVSLQVLGTRSLVMKVRSRQSVEKLGNLKKLWLEKRSGLWSTMSPQRYSAAMNIISSAEVGILYQLVVIFKVQWMLRTFSICEARKVSISESPYIYFQVYS